MGGSHRLGKPVGWRQCNRIWVEAPGSPDRCNELDPSL